MCVGGWFIEWCGGVVFGGWVVRGRVVDDGGRSCRRDDGRDGE